MTARLMSLLVASSLAAPRLAFVGVGCFLTRPASVALSRRINASPRQPLMRSLVVRRAAEEDAAPDLAQEARDQADVDNDDVEGVAKMRVKEIKAELDVRGVSYTGCYEKGDLVEKLVEARKSGIANPSIVDEFNKENLERKMDPEMAGDFAKDLLDEDKLKDMTAADGTLPGGMTPEQLTKMASNPEIMVLLQNPKLQDIMKKVMAGGPQVLQALQEDPETRDLLQRLDKAMASMKS